MPNTDDEWPTPRFEIEPVHNSKAWRVLRDGETLITTHATDNARAVAWQIAVALNTVELHGSGIWAGVRSREVVS